MEHSKITPGNASSPPAQESSSYFKDNTVRIAGIGQLIADTALLTYGIAKNDFKIGSIGILGYTAGFIGTRYGSPKSERQLQLVERDLGQYLRQQGVTLPKHPTLQNLTQAGGVIEHVEAFLYAYPTQLMNACFGLMGVQFMRAGVRDTNKAQMASGALMMAASLAGLLIQEQKPDPEHPPQGAMQKTWSWIQEKPLRLTGALLNLNQVFIARDAWNESKNPGNKAYLLKYLAVAGFTLCNTMLALSSQGDGGGAQLDDVSRKALSEAAAHAIVSQPKEVQNGLLEHVAGFLSTQPYVHMSAADISTQLRQKLSESHIALAPGRQL